MGTRGRHVERTRERSGLDPYISRLVYSLTSNARHLARVVARRIRRFPEEARRGAGYQLRRVQEGLKPNDWKPVPEVGRGVQEIRLHARGEHRVFYVARFAEAVYVLHGFEKKTRKTSKRDLELGRARYRDLIKTRGKERHDEE